MLKIRSPIELKARRSFVHDNESFYDRISANYSFLGRDIGPEELLHIANTPPEVYLAEGDLTTVAGNTVINSRNEEKLEIINNVLNRIAVSADAHLTYQDRAYITDVLYKMGIRDDRRFMNEVRRYVDESREEDRLINMYLLGDIFDEGDHIKNSFLSLVNRVNRQEERNNELFLSRSIMNRLGTGAVYQIVSNFNRSITDNSLNMSEFAVTGQTESAKRILTDRIRERVLRNNPELIYLENESEDSGQLNRDNRPDGNINEVFLSDSIINRLEKGTVNQTESNFNRNVTENSLNISEVNVTGQAGLRDRILTDRTRERELLNSPELIYLENESEDSGQHPETASAGALETRRENNVERNFNSYERELISREKTGINITESLGSALFLDIAKNIISNTLEKKAYGNNEWFDFRSILFRSSENLFERISSFSREMNAAGNIINNEYRTEGADITYREGPEEISNEYLGAGYERNESRLSERNEYSTEVQVNENTENGDIYRNEVNIEGATVIHPTAPVETAWDIIKRYENSVSTTEQNRYLSETGILNQSSSEESIRTGDTFRNEVNIEAADLSFPVNEEENITNLSADNGTETFERELIRLNEKNLSNVEKYNEMMTLIQSFERETKETGGPERTRREALKALDGGVDLASIISEEEGSEEERRDRLFREIVRIFPDSSGEIFNVIEQYMDNPQAAAGNLSLVNSNLSEAAEEIRRLQEREEPQPEEIREERNERKEELIFRENATLDIEEIQENIEELRRNSRVTRDRETRDETTIQNTVTTRNVVNTTNTSFTDREVMDIEEMVDRGVRSRMGAISEQVLNKLEKRLRNEKSRRGI